MLELLRAHLTDKPLVALFETNPKKGGLTLLEARIQLRCGLAELGERLAEEVTTHWGKPMPSCEELEQALFSCAPPLELSRLEPYRDRSLRALAELAGDLRPPLTSAKGRASSGTGGGAMIRRPSAHMRCTAVQTPPADKGAEELPQASTQAQAAAKAQASTQAQATAKAQARPSERQQSGRGSSRMPSEVTYMPSCPTRQPLAPMPAGGLGRTHVYYSRANDGAAELIEELNRWRGHRRQPPLTATSAVEELPRCVHFLLLLDGNTWTSEQAQKQALEKEVLQCAELWAAGRGPHLLPVHEEPDLVEEIQPTEWLEESPRARCGVPFDAFFDDGQTPPRLVKKDVDVYHEIAVPLKGGMSRPIGLAMLESAILKIPSPPSNHSPSNRHRIIRQATGGGLQQIWPA